MGVGNPFTKKLILTMLFEHQCADVFSVYYLFLNIGPSGVRAPLAAGINVGGHYKWHFFLFLSLLNLPEGVVIGIQIFAWAPK